MRSSMSMRSPLVIAGLILSIALGAVIASIYPMVNSISSESEHIGVTTGTALSGAVESSSPQCKGIRCVKHYTCRVPFSYEVNGIFMEQTRLLEDSCRSARPGTELKVYYALSDPTDSALHNPQNASYFVLIALIAVDVLILGMAIPVSVAMIRRHMRRTDAY